VQKRFGTTVFPRRQHAPVVGSGLEVLQQHEGGTGSEEGLMAEDNDGRRWELTVRVLRRRRHRFPGGVAAAPMARVDRRQGWWGVALGVLLARKKSAGRKTWAGDDRHLLTVGGMGGGSMHRGFGEGLGAVGGWRRGPVTTAHEQQSWVTVGWRVGALSASNKGGRGSLTCGPQIQNEFESDSNCFKP
jgi:hypothetical protein